MGKTASKDVPTALKPFGEMQRRYIVENFWPEAYSGDGLVDLWARDDDGAPAPQPVSAWDIREEAKRYAAGVAWGNLMRKLAADGGRSVREVPPISAWHTNPTAADMYKWSGNAFAFTCAKLAEQDGRSYMLFRKAIGTAVPAPEPAPEPAPVAPAVVTHEAYILAIRDTVLDWANGAIGDEARTVLAQTKVLYGLGLIGGGSVRGMTVYGTWQNGSRHDVIEICAAGEESDLQLAGTTVHELGHVLAGNTAGHGREWKEATRKLGLEADAAGQVYRAEAFDPTLWSRLQGIPLPTDGKPVLRAGQGTTGAPVAVKPCPLGVGTRGGTSRGKGSGSRLRLFECSCIPPVKARVARDEFRATCGDCGSAFTRKGENR